MAAVTRIMLAFSRSQARETTKFRWTWINFWPQSLNWLGLNDLTFGFSTRAIDLAIRGQPIFCRLRSFFRTHYRTTSISERIFTADHIGTERLPYFARICR